MQRPTPTSIRSRRGRQQGGGASSVVDVIDGNGLQIEFVHKTENPAIKAIEALVGDGDHRTIGPRHDDNPCTSDACDAGVCTNQANTCRATTATCTSGDVCMSGVVAEPAAAPPGRRNPSTDCAAPRRSVSARALAGAALLHRLLQFGPDGKLYVARKTA
jgi:hypothetical protein